MNTIQISNFDQLLEHALSVHNGWEEIKKIELSDNFNYHIIIKGVGWDGQFDQKVSEIVLGVHGAVIAAYANAEGLSNRSASLKYKKEIRVTATVEEGSCDLSIEVAKALQVAFEKMDGTQALIGLSVICATALTGYGLKKAVDYMKDKNKLLHDQKMKELDATEKAELLKLSNQNIDNVIKGNIEVLKAAQKPVEALVNVISEEDQVTVTSSNVTFSKKELKKNVEVPDIETPMTYYVDGEYIIREWKHYDELSGAIEKDGIILKNIEVLLNDEEKESLAKLVNTLDKVNLQVTVTVQNNKAKAVTVIGIGSLRNGTVPLTSILT